MILLFVLHFSSAIEYSLAKKLREIFRSSREDFTQLISNFSVYK